MISKMKRTAAVIFLLTATVTLLSAQSSVKGMNARGITGVVITPTARIGWEKSDMGLDFSYAMVRHHDADYMAHIPAVTLSLYKKAEIALAYDIENSDDDINYANIMAGAKYQLYNEGSTTLAIGGNMESVTGDRYDDIPDDNKNSADVYIVTTYGGDFFKMPAVTTMMFGWQALAAGDSTSNLNYSMGFEMGLFPDTFKNFVYWISDFSNYSYAIYQDKIGVSRGIFNTGLRIDPVKSSKYKFVINLIGTDLLDEGGRGLLLSTTFGLAF